MEKFYLYSPDIATVGKMYKKKIVLMSNMYYDANKLWSIFLKQNKNIKQDLIQEYKNNLTIHMPSYMERVLKIYVQKPQQYLNIDPREFDYEDSRITRIIKRKIYEIILENDKNTQKALQLLKRLGSKEFCRNDWYKAFIKIHSTFEIQKYRVIKPNKNNISEWQHAPNIDVDLQKQSNFNLNLKQEKKSILLGAIKKANKNNKKNGQKSNPNLYENNSSASSCNNLNKPVDYILNNSHIPHSMQTENANNYIENNVQILTLEQFTTEQKVQEDKRQQNLIGKSEYIINPKKENHLNDDLNPFSEITIETLKIKEQLHLAKPDLEWDGCLLKEIIILEASGIRTNQPNRLCPAIGESIHLFSHQLLRLQAYKKNPVKILIFYLCSLILFELTKKTSSCRALKKLLKTDYSPIGLNQNNPLPKWLHCQIIDGIIYIWGTPMINDDPEILIRVIDQLRFTIMSFIIKIKDIDGNDINEKSYASSVVRRYKPEQIEMHQNLDCRLSSFKINSESENPALNIISPKQKKNKVSIQKGYEMNTRTPSIILETSNQSMKNIEEKQVIFISS